jgi:hypothetical protein
MSSGIIVLDQKREQPSSTLDTGWKPMLLYAVTISTWVLGRASGGRLSTSAANPDIRNSNDASQTITVEGF